MKLGSKFKRLFSMFMAFLLIFQNVISYTVHAAEEKPTVYLYHSGADENDGTYSKPVKTVRRAYELLQDTGGEIIMRSSLTISEDTTITSTSYKDDKGEVRTSDDVSFKRYKDFPYSELFYVSEGVTFKLGAYVDGYNITNNIVSSPLDAMVVNHGNFILEEGGYLTNSCDIAVMNHNVFTLNGGTISKLKTTTGKEELTGIYNSKGSETIIESGLITSVGDSGITNHSGTVYMNGGEINGTTTGIENGEPGSHTQMNGGKITGCTNGIYNTGTFVMLDGEITKNIQKGVYNYTGSTEMYGGSISDNKEKNYDTAGIYVLEGDISIYGGTISNELYGISMQNKDTSSLTVKDGLFTNNKTGIINYIYQDYIGTAKIKGGTFENNGVALNNFNVLEIDGSVVVRNNETGVKNINDGKLTIGEGSFTNNTTNAIYNTALFYMNGGSVNNNHTTASGAGIYNSGEMYFTDGQIYDNKSEKYGDGIYQSGNLYMSKNARVDISNNIYVKKPITIPAELNPDTEIYALLTPESYAQGRLMVSVEYGDKKGSDLLYSPITGEKKWLFTEKDNWTLLGSDETDRRDTENEIIIERSTTNPRYTIKFENYDNSLLSSKIYSKGASIAVPEAKRESENPKEYIWEFIGWAPEVSETAVADAVYVAQYKKKFIDYEIIFKDHDGSEISKKTYHYEDEISIPQDPERASEHPKEYTWVFTGWSPKVAQKATENVTYVAQYEKRFIDYEVVFKDHDGSEISKKTYHYGDEIAVPEAPKRVSDKPEEYAWIFTGWSPKVAQKATENVTYVAQYEKKFQDYEIIFQDYDGSEISNKKYNYKMEIEIPKDPQRDSDEPEKYTWVFTGWSPEVSKHAVESVTYVAQYEKKDTMHSIVFQDYDGSEISNQSYKYDEKIVIPDNPTRKSEEPEKYTWIFTGWSPEISEHAVGSVTYVAQYEKQDREYTIIFKDWDDTIISEKKYKYGEKIEIPENPVRKSETDNVIYKFAQWLPNLNDIAIENASYTADYFSVSLPGEEVPEPEEPKDPSEDEEIINPETPSEDEGITKPETPSEDEGITNPNTPSNPSEDEVIVKPETPSEDDKAEQKEENAPAEEQKQEKEPVKYTAGNGEQNNINNPETGDNSINPYYLLFAFILSGIGIVYVLFRRKRSN